MPNSQRLARAGVRAVAAFEAAKGLLILVAGFGLFGLFHRDAQHGAEMVVRHLHLNPARHISRVFIKAASRLTNTRLLLLAGGALAYAALRFVEAYGLWRERPWAEWLAIVAAGLYLPVEVFEAVRHRTLLSAVLLLTNALIVFGLLYVRLSAAPAEPRTPS
jgi:uncharacterized membrane protein (DUF2068 family)